jgi:integrase
MAKARDNIRQRGSGWQAQIRLKGEPTRTKTFRRKSDAKDWVAKTVTEIREGRALPGTWARKHTFAELVAEYNTLQTPRYGARERNKRAIRLGWWLEQLGPVRVADLNRERINRTAGVLATHGGRSGKPAGPATQVRYLAMLSHVFAFAVRRGYLNENPARAAVVERPPEPKARVRFLSHEERERLLAACRRSHDCRLYPVVLTALGTGARVGEVMGLRWPDVDLLKGVATLRVTKNKDTRSLSLIPQVVDALRAMPRRIGADDFIFAGPRGRAAFPREGWERALREAAIEDFHFHDLRHTFASYLAMSGATLPELAAALGHKTLAMVQRYAHLSKPHMDSVVRRMGETYLAQA